MATNGANAQTREQMQSLLGGNIPIEVLNEYLYTYVNSLPNGEKYKVNIANSIWLRNKENFKINQSFLQTRNTYPYFEKHMNQKLLFLQLFQKPVYF